MFYPLWFSAQSGASSGALKLRNLIVGHLLRWCLILGASLAHRRILLRFYKALAWAQHLDDAKESKRELREIQVGASSVLRKKGGIGLWLRGLGVVLLLRSPTASAAIAVGVTLAVFFGPAYLLASGLVLLLQSITPP